MDVFCSVCCANEINFATENTPDAYDVSKYLKLFFFIY